MPPRQETRRNVRPHKKEPEPRGVSYIGVHRLSADTRLAEAMYDLGFNVFVKPYNITSLRRSSEDWKSPRYREIHYDGSAVAVKDRVEKTPEFEAVRSATFITFWSGFGNEDFLAQVNEHALTSTRWDDATKARLRAYAYDLVGRRGEELRVHYEEGMPEVAARYAEIETRFKAKAASMLSEDKLQPMTDFDIRQLLADVVARMKK